MTSNIPNTRVWDARPLLVVPVYRGGLRFERCLASLIHAGGFFSGLVLSINGPTESPDLVSALKFQESVDFPVEILNTEVEMTSMDHIRYWTAHLQKTKIPLDQQIMWLGHDDELDPVGLAQSCPDGVWPLRENTMVLGPWKLRHESVDSLYEIPMNEKLETWTCFPDPAQLPMKSMDWACDQLLHPTYINLTGGVFPFRSLQAVVEFKPRKVSGMRMEMTLATAPGSGCISELPEAITIVYGRADSDRATIPRKDALNDDRNLLLWLSKFATLTTGSRKRFTLTLLRIALLRGQVLLGRAEPPGEDWVVRKG